MATAIHFSLQGVSTQNISNIKVPNIKTEPSLNSADEIIKFVPEENALNPANVPALPPPKKDHLVTPEVIYYQLLEQSDNEQSADNTSRTTERPDYNFSNVSGWAGKIIAIVGMLVEQFQLLSRIESELRVENSNRQFTQTVNSAGEMVKGAKAGLSGAIASMATGVVVAGYGTIKTWRDTVKYTKEVTSLGNKNAALQTDISANQQIMRKKQDTLQELQPKNYQKKVNQLDKDLNDLHAEKNALTEQRVKIDKQLELQRALDNDPAPWLKRQKEITDKLRAAETEIIQKSDERTALPASAAEREARIKALKQEINQLTLDNNKLNVELGKNNHLLDLARRELDKLLAVAQLLMQLSRPMSMTAEANWQLKNTTEQANAKQSDVKADQYRNIAAAIEENKRKIEGQRDMMIRSLADLMAANIATQKTIISNMVRG
ncbi:hypothetical protein N5923_09190 [Erwiniaceae bacterium BAC15a-03b]|uniref:Uncharacterized protein n=1 Tax=Winslowiella arboricola TaxID=2978220 RepID=A0A9J6PJW9_9GAMM|nr:hypothetical protein [Winslowiella arboricola]MCU5773756.1 hypothetical protein [Winslowiella arboricola]MCU5777666.1 hypothetical protein [Winslowiella arboricola]